MIAPKQRLLLVTLVVTYDCHEAMHHKTKAACMKSRDQAIGGVVLTANMIIDAIAVQTYLYYSVVTSKHFTALSLFGGLNKQL